MVTSCPSCGKQFKAKDDAVGQRATCPGCKHFFMISPGIGRPFPERSSPGTVEQATSGPGPADEGPVLPPPLPTLGKSAAFPPADSPPPLNEPRRIGPRFSGEKIEIGRYRHPKETTYLVIAAVFSVLVWVLILHFVYEYFAPALLALPIVLLLMWMVQQFYKATVFGNSVRVNEHQHKEVFEMASEISTRLGIRKIPHIFIVNSEGAVNALAVRFIGSRYVLLYSSLVDLMLSGGRKSQLKMILGHELAHHGAGHVAIGRNLLLMPSMRVPYLGPAYKRACELTADRIGLVLVGDTAAAKDALAYLACGSLNLSPKMNLSAFLRQESEIPAVFGFFNEIFSSHPRITKRVAALQKYADKGAIA